MVWAWSTRCTVSNAIISCVSATLLSCLKGLGMEYSVYSIRRAIMATAEAMTTPGADPFAVGSGMLRVRRRLKTGGGGVYRTSIRLLFFI